MRIPRSTARRWPPESGWPRGEGSRIVCLQELTLSAYFATTPDGPEAAGAPPEDLESGPTVSFASEQAIANGLYVHASLYERADADDGLGFNTAVVVAPDGRLLSRTRKLHIPVTAGYYEDKYFRQGPAEQPADQPARPDNGPFPLVPVQIGEDPAGDWAQLGCADLLGPVVSRARARLLAGGRRGARLSDRDRFRARSPRVRHPAAVAAGDRRQRRRANGTFMVAINRIGSEGPLVFYGSSFISDPYGRILVQGPRDQPAVLVADLDLDQRRDWLELFPFLTTRRPDAYEILTRR